MKPALRLNPIDREHIQELYDQTGMARDELPYTDEFDALCQGFQDRTFKNADPEQVYGAIIKYVRSSTCPSVLSPFDGLTDEQIRTLKGLAARHGRGGKIMPYSSEFNAMRAEFNQQTDSDLSERDFWRALLRATGAHRRPPRRAAAAAS